MRIQTLLAAAGSLSYTVVQATAVQHNHVKRGAEPAYVGPYVYIGCYLDTQSHPAMSEAPGAFMYGEATIETCANSCNGNTQANPGHVYQYFSVQGQSVSN